MAYHSHLTDLPNRHYFIEKLQQKLEQANLNEEFGILFLDLDNLKKINDFYGHFIGDQILKKVGKRLLSLNTDEFTAHIDGDEYAILMNGNKTKIKESAKKIIKSLRQPFHIENNDIYVTGSIGISMFPADGVNKDKLMQVADLALFEAKRTGKNKYIFYNDELKYRRLRKN